MSLSKPLQLPTPHASGMAEIHLVVDANHNENETAEALSSLLGRPVERRPLKTADILVHGNGRSFLIERKVRSLPEPCNPSS